MKFNDGMRNSLADSFADLFDGGILKVYTGAAPADPDDAATGTLLATIDLPTPAFGAAAANSVAKAGVWSSVGVDDGTAGWCRLSNAAGTKWVDLTVGVEVAFDDPDIVTDGLVVVSVCTYSVAES